jgi:hypothetical protein
MPCGTIPSPCRQQYCQVDNLVMVTQWSQADDTAGPQLHLMHSSSQVSDMPQARLTGEDGYRNLEKHNMSTSCSITVLPFGEVQHQPYSQGPKGGRQQRTGQSSKEIGRS